MSNNTSYIQVLEPIKLGDYNTNVSIANADWSYNASNYSGSGIAFQTAVYSKTLPEIGNGTYITNSYDGSLQNLIWYHINHKYYNNPYVASQTFEHHTNDSEKRLFYSASVFSIPYAYTGEKLNPGSVTITTPSFTLTDDGVGNLRNAAISTSSFVSNDYLKAYWSFDDAYKKINNNFGTITDTIEWTSNNLVGSFFLSNQISTVNNVNFQPGLTSASINTGICAQFDGTSSYIKTLYQQKQFDYDKDDDFAISTWVKCSNSQSISELDAAILISMRGSDRTLQSSLTNLTYNTELRTITSYPWDISIGAIGSSYPGRIVARRSDGLYSTTITSSIVTDNNWHHILYQKTGSNLQLYVDGTAMQTTTDNLIDNPVNRSNVYFGALNEYSSGSFNGSLDEIRIYNKALTQTEINALSNPTTAYQTNVVGNVFYRSGMIVTSSPFSQYNSLSNWTISFQSTHRVYESQVLVRISKDKFNRTNNPSATDFILRDAPRYIGEMISGSLTPYITTVGLYNDTGDLVAIGKLARPLQKRSDIDTNILIRWDF
jgi:hypothetical protein